MKPRLLVVQNVPWEGPGLIELHAKAAGIPLTKVELFKGSRIPFDEVKEGDFSAVVGLGSPSTAYLPDSHPRYEDLVRLFRLVRQSEVPSFNICYSMQLFSLVHGGRVAKNPAGKEVGFKEVRPTKEGASDPVLGPIGRYTTLQWHGDIVQKLPKGAVRLASSAQTENQVAVLDEIHYLFQSDGQAATPAMVRSWLTHDSKWATNGTGLRPTEMVREAVSNEAYFRNTFLRIFANFLAVAIRR